MHGLRDQVWKSNRRGATGCTIPRVRSPTDVFVSYAPADEALCKELEKHLYMLKRAGEIRTWAAYKTGPGEDWRNVLLTRLDSAHVILLLLSADFFASDQCYDVEVEKALAHADKGRARVIPIRVRPYDWGAVPFERLRVLPANGTPVVKWPNPEDAWAEVALEVRLASRDPIPEPKTASGDRQFLKSDESDIEQAPENKHDSTSEQGSLIVRVAPAPSPHLGATFSTGGYRDHGSIFSAVERSMIACDARFYVDFFRTFVKKRADPIMSIGLLPHISLCVVESMKYLGDRAPATARDLHAKHASVLQASSARIALLDDRQRGLEGVLMHAQWITDLYRRWFIGAHSGLLAPFKRMIQPDLGLYTSDGRLVCTSHVAFFNQGFDQKDIYERLPNLADLGPAVRAIAEDVGGYLAQLVAQVPSTFSTAEGQFTSQASCKPTEAKDVKSSWYYGAIASRFLKDNEAAAAFLTYLLSYVNFINVSLRAVARPDSQTFFKAKFLVAYYAIISLARLRVHGRKNASLADVASRLLGQLLGDQESRWLRRQDALRGMLTGYRIDGVPQDSIVPERPLFGLVEALMPDQTFELVDALLDRVLQRVSDVLQQVMAEP